jgi:hypothetical protein
MKGQGLRFRKALVITVLQCPPVRKTGGEPFPGLYEPNRRTARAWALAASTSRFRGDAVVTKAPSRVEEAWVTSSTARLKAFWFAADGLANPLIFLRNCRAAIRISAPVAGGSKLYRFLIFLHTSLTSRHRIAAVLRMGGDSIGCSLISHDRFFLS